MKDTRLAVAVPGLACISMLTAADAVAGCAGKWPLRWEMPLSHAHVGKSMSQVFNQKGFHRASSLRNNDKRLSFARAPGGDTAIRMNVRKGENKIVSFHLSPLGKPGAEKACLTLQVYLSRNFDWATAGSKLGWGLWGGDSSSNSSGGMPPQKQQGWSLRNVNNARGARAYSYHLNRKGKSGSAAKCKPYKCLFGQSLGSRVALRAGQWNDVELEVQMNTVGSANGSLAMWINGTKVTQQSGIRWRNKGSWAIRGLKFTDMWGGKTSDRKNFSPKSQEIFYRRYRLYATNSTGSGGAGSGGFAGNSGDDGASGSSADNSSHGNSASFGPIHPEAGSHVRPPAQLVWAKHSKADKYYLKIVDDKRKVRLRKQYRLNKIDCNSAAVCKVAYDGQALRNGRHTMILRAVRGGSKLKEYRFGFTVAANGDGFTAGSAGQGSSGGGSGGSKAGSGSTGRAVTAQGPSGTTKDRRPTFVWTADDVDRYYLKVVDDKRRTQFVKKLSPAAANCERDSRCEFTGPGLKSGSYRWWVRGVYGSRKGPDSTSSFRIR